MKNKQQGRSKVVIVVAIAICLFFGYLNIKSGSQNNGIEGWFIAISGYFAITIAALASIVLLKRTFSRKS